VESRTWTSSVSRAMRSEAKQVSLLRGCVEQIVWERWEVPQPHYRFPSHSPLMHYHMSSLVAWGTRL
jgi:hypothetical protein